MIFILALLLNLTTPVPRSVTLEITNIEKVQGTVRICICNQPDQFLRNCFSSKNVQVDSKKLLVLLDEVPEGPFSISVFHDENDNSQLDSGLFRIPKEPYGFSNNPSSTFGPPSYEKCLVGLDTKTITIKLK